MPKLHVRALDQFNRWFTSAAGVWQTAIITAGVLVWEAIDPHADPHGFWLLFALTVYSGVTQPALAYVAARSADNTDRNLDRDVTLAEQTHALLIRIADRIEEQP